MNYIVTHFEILLIEAIRAPPIKNLLKQEIILGAAIDKVSVHATVSVRTRGTLFLEYC